MNKKLVNKEIMIAIKSAPLLSPSVYDIIRKIAEPDHSLADVVKIVKHDSALTARLLRVVNSAAFATLDPVNSVDRAISLLGERMVVGLAISESTGNLFHKPLEGYDGKKGDLWSHDLIVAYATRKIAGLAKINIDPELAFTGGLLHDIGKAIISDFLKGTAEELLQSIDKGHVDDYASAEKNFLGVNHQAVGYELAMNWNLPESIQQMILHHHSPAESDDEFKPYVYAVHLGDIISMMSGFGTGTDIMQYNLDQGYEEYFNLKFESIASVMLEIKDKCKRVIGVEDCM